MPPGFLLVLSCLSAPVLVYHGFVKPYAEARRRSEERNRRAETENLERLKRLVSDAYHKLRLVYNPKLMTPNQDPPPNLDYMQEEAKVAVMRVSNELDLNQIQHPRLEYTANEVLEQGEWHVFLSRLWADFSR